MEAPYGSWTSPISGRLIAEGGVGLGWPQALKDSLFWVEQRPLEEGRHVVVRRDRDARIADVTPRDHNARTLVHEYGGGMYRAFGTPEGGESVVFSGYADQRLYRQDLLGAAAGGAARWSAPRPITPPPPIARAWRYADGVVTPDGSLLICVRERHDGDAVVNDLVAVPSDGSSEPRILAQGHDFFSSPRLSQDGSRLAWLAWDHPNMPWDGTELWAAAFDPDGGLSQATMLAGGPEESVLQPLWSRGGALHFVSDRSGWWNIYRLDQPRGLSGPSVVSPVAPLEAEFAKPSWVFGLQNYGFLPDERIVAYYSQDGVDHLAVLDAAGPQELTIPYSVVAGTIVVMGEDVGLVAASPTRSWDVAIVRPPVPETDPSLIEPPPGVDPAKSTIIEVVRRARTDTVDPRYISRPEPIVFPTWYDPGTVTGSLAEEIAEAGEARAVVGLERAAASPPGLEAHALYFPPTNEDFSAPEGELPPLLVISHGGPTSAHEANLSMDIQYWTSRGFAVVDVNYGGSSGYGRAYRERLKGNWGIVDTIDCMRAAEYLVERGDVDPERLAVRGGSAGGYTTLNALTRHRFFAAGASHFGLADLERFVSGGTHKFEERYLIQLVGPYPEAAALYRERSPINHVDDIACPVILLQGLDDAIVPPEQAEMIAAALARKGLPYAYLAFEGEQHGFRKSENIVRSLEAELFFYGKVFGFTPADEIEPVAIENLT